MKKIFIKPINQLIVFDKNIQNISIESIPLYKRFIFNLENELILSENDKEVDDKFLLIIKEPFSIDVNDSKLIKGLYKKIITLLDDSMLQDLNTIQRVTYDIIDRLSIKIDSNIEYNDIDFSKLLSSISLKFEETNEDNFLDMLINFFKIYVDLFNIKFVITFRLLDFLTAEEYMELEFKLGSLGIVLLNFSFVTVSIQNELIIDDDYCII